MAVIVKPLNELPDDIRTMLPACAINDSHGDMFSVLYIESTDVATLYYSGYRSIESKVDYYYAYAMAHVAISKDGKILKSRYRIEKYDIYIAGSFGTPEERSELELMVSFVKHEHPNSVIFVPMEHFIPGGNDKDENDNYIMPNDEWGKRVFEMDLAALRECHTVYNLYRGHISGSGTAWELGYAYATNKRIIQYIPSNVTDVSVMCYNCASEHINDNTNINQK